VSPRSQYNFANELPEQAKHQLPTGFCFHSPILRKQWFEEAIVGGPEIILHQGTRNGGTL